MWEELHCLDCKWLNIISSWRTYEILVFQASETKTEFTNFLDAAFFSNTPVDFLQPQCASNSQFSVPIQLGSATVQQGSVHGQSIFDNAYLLCRTIDIMWYCSLTYFLVIYPWSKTRVFSETCFLFNSDVRCVQGLHLWRNSSSEINNELYKGYRKGNPERQINEIVAGLWHHYNTAIKLPFYVNHQVLVTFFCSLRFC